MDNKLSSDIIISQNTKLSHISDIADKLNLTTDDIICYGNNKAKISYSYLNSLEKNPKKGKLILVTAITPTSAGEGKSTVAIGLADGLNKLNKDVCLALREPSMGPCFGIKGGATGGGYAQIAPMEDINLNFTGDMHAITSANNLLCSMIDNHIQNGNQLNIEKILFHRCLDLNDRALRHIFINNNETKFDITAASEIMAILCLATNISDLKQRIDNIIIGTDKNNIYIYAKSLSVSGAMAAILKDAMLPNLVQTLEHTPCFVHGGPFANISHGTNSIISTNLALKLSDYVVTEAGFASDLGAEKYINLVSRVSNNKPDAIVLVATARALKMHGGVAKDKLKFEDLTSLKIGCDNLKAHINIIKTLGYKAIVAINIHKDDTQNEINLIKQICQDINIKGIEVTSYTDGGNGSIELAQEIIQVSTSKPKYTYENQVSIQEKIKAIACQIYKAKSVVFENNTKAIIEKINNSKHKNLPICMAKTQNSISHDKKLLNSPIDFVFPITDIKISSGAGYIVVYSGNIYTMPGLPKQPAALDIDIDDNGNISGLF